MDFSPEAKAEVQQMIGESMGEGVHRLEPALGSAQWSESTLFRPTRAGREVRVDAVTPQGRFLTNLARHPGYSARRAGHILGAPARFVEKINRASEGFARRQAYVAKTYQMTGKMAHNMPELEKILREGKIKGNEEKMQELLMGPNGPMDALGDYGRMSAREREYVTAVIPSGSAPSSSSATRAGSGSCTRSPQGSPRQPRRTCSWACRCRASRRI
jgi:hypothetical protein